MSELQDRLHLILGKKEFCIYLNGSSIIGSKNYRGSLCAFYSEVGFHTYSMTRYRKSESPYHPYFQTGDVRQPSSYENMQLQSTCIFKSPSAEIFKKIIF